MEIKTILQDFTDRLEAFGYDKVECPKIEFSIDYNGELAATASAYLEDDFQKKLTYDDRVQYGYETFLITDERVVIPPAFKSREQRELEVMVNRLGRNAEVANQMTSAAGREFARRLTEDLDKYKMIGRL